MKTLRVDGNRHYRPHTFRGCTYSRSAAADEDPRTFWVAARNAPGETLTIDLGGVRTVRAVQVNFADFESGRYGGARDIYTQFVLEGSTDGKQWRTLADLSRETVDRPNAYVELQAAARMRYVRYVHGHVGAKTLAIADLRVFGTADGALPAAPVLVSARRQADRRNADIVWKPVAGAVGYNVRWGISADRLHSTYQRFADQPTSLTLRALSKGVTYAVAVEAFNENGVSPLSRAVHRWHKRHVNMKTLRVDGNRHYRPHTRSALHLLQAMKPARLWA